MKVYRVQDPKTKEFLSTQNRNWIDDVGTIFTSLQAAKKGIGYQKRRATKYLRYFTGSDNLATELRDNWQASLDKANRADIIEYDMIEFTRYDAQEAKVNEPIQPDDKGQALNPCDCLDKVDFSNIQDYNTNN